MHGWGFPLPFPTFLFFPFFFPFPFSQKQRACSPSIAHLPLSFEGAPPIGIECARALWKALGMLFSLPPLYFMLPNSPRTELKMKKNREWCFFLLVCVCVQMCAHSGNAYCYSFSFHARWTFGAMQVSIWWCGCSLCNTPFIHASHARKKQPLPLSFLH